MHIKLNEITVTLEHNTSFIHFLAELFCSVQYFCGIHRIVGTYSKWLFSSNKTETYLLRVCISKVHLGVNSLCDDEGPCCKSPCGPVTETCCGAGLAWLRVHWPVAGCSVTRCWTLSPRRSLVTVILNPTSGWWPHSQGQPNRDSRPVCLPSGPRKRSSWVASPSWAKCCPGRSVGSRDCTLTEAAPRSEMDDDGPMKRPQMMRLPLRPYTCMDTRRDLRTETQPNPRERERRIYM